MNNYQDLNKDYDHKPPGYYDWVRQEVMPFMPQSPRSVLDIGCSGGSFAAEAKKRFNCVAWGIEPNMDAAKVAATKLDHVICDVFHPGHPELVNKKFDAIIFNDVLEHLVNPNTTLRDCKQLLTENGCIVASIPNILFFPVFFEELIMQEDWRYVDAGTLDKTHLRFFTRKSIIRMFEQEGYEVKMIEGINPQITKRYRRLNKLLFNRLTDWKYLQFGVQAQVRKE